MPQWSGDSSPAVGNVGGGTWLLSAHSKNLKAATDFLTWVTTSDDYQGKLAPGLPGYTAAAKTWLAAQAPPATTRTTSRRPDRRRRTRSGPAGATASSARKPSGRPPSPPA